MKDTGEYGGRRVAIIGGGRAGHAAARALLDLRAHVTLYDAKPLEDLGEEVRSLVEAGCRMVTGRSDHPGIEGADVIVPSPGVRFDAPVLAAARERGQPIHGEIEVAYRIADAPIVAVTGTNGKSTTTSMCGAMLTGSFSRVWVGGNLAPGEPICSLARRAGPGDVIVAEVSSFQLETASSFRPRVAILTNFSPDHLDRHRDMAEYAAMKSRIFTRQGPADFTVVNAGCIDVPELGIARARSRVAPFSIEPPDPLLSDGAWVENGWLIASCQGRRARIAALDDVPLAGSHNVENALAASLAAWLMRASPEAIRKGLREFHAVAHRMETVATVDGVRYVNNSMCTNPAALTASLLSFTEPVVVIAGGKNKRLDFAGAGAVLREKARGVILIGTSAREIEQSIGGGGAPVAHAVSLEEAVSKARSLARPGDVVMLAPGCASLDMFKDFMDRGSQFTQIVLSMSEASSPDEAGTRLQ